MSGEKLPGSALFKACLVEMLQRIEAGHQLTQELQTMFSAHLAARQNEQWDEQTTQDIVCSVIEVTSCLYHVWPGVVMRFLTSHDSISVIEEFCRTNPAWHLSQEQGRYRVIHESLLFGEEPLPNADGSPVRIPAGS